MNFFLFDSLSAILAEIKKYLSEKKPWTDEERSYFNSLLQKLPNDLLQYLLPDITDNFLEIDKVIDKGGKRLYRENLVTIPTDTKELESKIVGYDFLAKELILLAWDNHTKYLTTRLPALCSLNADNLV